jgi:hypothetical protein
MHPDPPQTLVQAVDRLLAELSAEEREELRLMKEDQLIDLHFSLGMGIRNSFPIWGNEALLRSCAAERRRRIEAEMNKLLTANRGKKAVEADIRELFGRLLQAEAIHPDDASNYIIHAAWERLQDRMAADSATFTEIQPVRRKPWWLFWR